VVAGGAEPDPACRLGPLRRRVWPCRYTVPLLYGMRHARRIPRRVHGVVAIAVRRLDPGAHINHPRWEPTGEVAEAFAREVTGRYGRTCVPAAVRTPVRVVRTDDAPHRGLRARRREHAAGLDLDGTQGCRR
jgi:hypothetical protein